MKGCNRSKTESEGDSLLACTASACLRVAQIREGRLLTGAQAGERKYIDSRNIHAAQMLDLPSTLPHHHLCDPICLPPPLFKFGLDESEDFPCVSPLCSAYNNRYPIYSYQYSHFSLQWPLKEKDAYCSPTLEVWVSLTLRER